jgi:hypothetical protein
MNINALDKNTLKNLLLSGTFPIFVNLKNRIYG